MSTERHIDLDDIPASDVGDPVELYELSLEQVLSTPTKLDAATRKRIRIQDFLKHGKFTDATHYLTRKIDNVNFMEIVASATIHGISIFQHEHDEIISELNTLKDDALDNTYNVYNEMYPGFKPTVSFGANVKHVWVDPQSYDIISSYASTLHIPCGHLETVLLCMSYAESTMLPEHIVKECAEKSKMFNIACNICLDNLKRLKY